MYSAEKYKNNVQAVKKHWKEYENRRHKECFDEAYKKLLSAFDSGSSSVYLGGSTSFSPSSTEYLAYFWSLSEFKEFWFLPGAFDVIRIIPKPKWVIKLERMFSK